MVVFIGYDNRNIHLLMVNEDLLATYSLLSFIRDNSKTDQRKSLIYVFVPLVKEGLSRVVAKHGEKRFMGKDYTEIKDQISEAFKITVPIPVLESILPIISQESNDLFQLNTDHSFVINPNMADSIMIEHARQKERINELRDNYWRFCEGEGVNADFEGLVQFVQNQKNRLFDSDYSLRIEDQNYHISKYVNLLIKRRNSYFQTLCDLYLGGIISSYLKFKVNSRIVDTELLIDTNFYISLINLNTEESYDTCNHLFELTVGMGFRYKILETTISQIRVLLNNRISNFGNKDVFSAIDQADILAACDRRKMSVSDLQAYKDGLQEDLTKRGITTIYNTNIPRLVEKAKKSKDFKVLERLRGSQNGALNDLLAQEYVEYKRSNEAIGEFNDVNCWFLTNSYSINKTELDQPIWKRHYINASDLLVLLWYSNPAQDIGVESTVLAVTSLSANVLKYRTGKHPSEKVIKELAAKIATLQQSGYITENALAKLCIRMSEGCIDNSEAERLVSFSTKDFVEYVKLIQDREVAYNDELEENDSLRKRLALEKQDKQDIIVRERIKTQRAWSIVYVLVLLVLFFVPGSVIGGIGSGFLKVALNLLYWLISVVGVNLVSHWYFLDGLRSFFQYDKVYQKKLRALKRDRIIG